MSTEKNSKHYISHQYSLLIVARSLEELVCQFVFVDLNGRLLIDIVEADYG
jgi:hypothetical protein